MKLNKEIRQLSRKMVRASFTDGQLDPGRVASLVDSLVARKRRNYIDVLKNYRRLLRLELEKRHATIETASEVDPAVRFRNCGQSEEQIWQRPDNGISS